MNTIQLIIFGYVVAFITNLIALVMIYYELIPDWATYLVFITVTLSSFVFIVLTVKLGLRQKKLIRELRTDFENIGIDSRKGGMNMVFKKKDNPEVVETPKAEGDLTQEELKMTVNMLDTALESIPVRNARELLEAQSIISQYAILRQKFASELKE